MRLEMVLSVKLDNSIHSALDNMIYFISTCPNLEGGQSRNGINSQLVMSECVRMLALSQMVRYYDASKHGQVSRVRTEENS